MRDLSKNILCISQSHYNIARGISQPESSVGCGILPLSLHTTSSSLHDRMTVWGHAEHPRTAALLDAIPPRAYCWIRTSVRTLPRTPLQLR